MALYKTLKTLEHNPELHLARILILLGVFSGKNGNGTIDGLPKLAKLDFLVRYPIQLRKALNAIKARESIELKSFEEKSVESTMVRFRYGPWDFRYRTFFSILHAKGLVNIWLEKRTIKISLTDRGKKSYEFLAQNEAFNDTLNRAFLVKKHFNMGASELMNFIYDAFPEISSLKYGEEISHEI